MKICGAFLRLRSGFGALAGAYTWPSKGDRRQRETGLIIIYCAVHKLVVRRIRMGIISIIVQCTI